MPIILEPPPQPVVPRQADVVTERAGKPVERIRLVQSNRIKVWVLAFFAVFITGTLGAFLFIIQKDLSHRGRAAEIKPSACADQEDNDQDARVDYPQDPGCDSASDRDESDLPSPAEAP